MVSERPEAVLEVRIHGVSGGAPADMLGQVPVELVAVLPLAIVAGLWYLARRTWSSYEAQEPPDATRPPNGGGLDDPGFWRGTHPVRRLRATHLAPGISTVACVLVWPILAFDREQGSGRTTFGWLVIGALGLVVGACIVFIGLPRFTDRRPNVALDWFAFGSAVLAGGATAGAIAYAMLSRPGWSTTGRLPGFGGVVTGLFTAQAVALLLVTLLLRRGAAEHGAIGGLAAPMTAALGWLLGGAFSAGISFRVADWLDGPRTPDAHPADQPIVTARKARVIRYDREWPVAPKCCSKPSLGT